MAHQKPSTSVDQVYEYLSTNIQSGQWKPGDKLPSEAELCNLMNVSRITIRSALGRLSALGLVHSKQGKGTFVSVPSPPSEATAPLLHNMDRLSLFEFRKIIEGESAALAAMRATTEDVAAMRETIIQMESAKTVNEIADQDMLFHELISKASGNEIVQYIFCVNKDAYKDMFLENVAHLGASGAIHHRQILLDIQVRDSEAARQHMNAHLDETARVICNL